MTNFRQLYQRTDRRIVEWLQRYSIPILRLSLGIVFLWFGLLKVIGASPVEALVVRVVPWASPTWFIPFLGLWETAIGVGLLLRVALRLTLLLLFVQLAGTFLLLVAAPDLAFNGNPLYLTEIGEFVVKNLVLLSAGLVVGATVRGEELSCLTPAPSEEAP